MSDPGPLEIVGRETELADARRWVGRLGDGPAGLVLEGEPGIGKSTLWREAVDLAGAAGVQILSSRPVEAELPYGYAALGDLLRGSIEPRLGALPAPQAEALAVALSLTPARTPSDPLLVGRATVAALGLLAADRPVVIAIDDVQWLDGPSARALAFAARRLESLPVGMAITMRDGHADPLDLAGALGGRTMVIGLGPMSLGATGRLLRSGFTPDMPRHMILRIHNRAAGNPLFALELARAGTERLPASLEDLMARSLDEAPLAARSAIELVAVLGPAPVATFGDPALLDAAIAAGVLVEDAGTVRFTHPLVAAAAYGRIGPGRRRALHREAATAAQSLEARAQHLALATPGSDASTAEIVEEAASMARGRGAVETAVALAEHARRITPPDDADALARRTMDLAEYLYLAADERGAKAIVDDLLATPVRGETRVRALIQRALTAAEATVAVAALEEAVREPHDDRLLRARTLHQLAWQRGAWLGDIEPALEEARRAVEQADAIGDEATLVSALTTLGLISSLAIRPDAADHFRRALDILARVPTAAGDHTPRLAFAHERFWRGDFATAETLLADERALAIQQGDEGLIMRLDLFGAEFELRRGRWDDAARLLEAALAEARDYWRGTALIRRAILRARRGDPGAMADAEELRGTPGDPILAAAGDFAAGLVAAAGGRIDEAATLVYGLLNRSGQSGSRGPEFAVLTPEAIAILVAAGRIAECESLTDRLERRHDQLAPWGDAASALCRGLIELGKGDGDRDRTEALIDTARRGFEAIGSPWELGQSLLAAGALFRRTGQRRRAGDALEQAVAIFQQLRAEPSRQRALDDLRRARPRPRSDDRLTAAEARVAALVAQGHPNREVAAQLFTTVATVEAHLTHIYAKLDIRSRTELARKVSDGSISLDA
jgi:DNA-binding CsgD family transcriptional regulator/tetratricopeptide (TPR) repeat protein